MEGIEVGTSRRFYMCKRCNWKRTVDFVITQYGVTDYWKGLKARYTYVATVDGKRYNRDGMGEVAGFTLCPHCNRWADFRDLKHTAKNDVPCNARCVGATSGVCECSCGGANHGGKHCY